jgi:sugar/nucleoside kinase (ribokinase family)
MKDILEDAGVRIEGIRPGQSSCYELDYEGGERRLRLIRHSSKIEREDVPRSMLSYQALHLGPIESELGRSVSRLAPRFDLVTLDIQGMARSFRDTSGLVAVRSKLNGESEQILAGVDVVKFSRNEALALLGPRARWGSAAGELHERGIAAVIVTLGPEGAIVYEPGRSLPVPPYPSKPVDWTGAGDSFMAGLVFRYLQGMGIEDSARFGSALAASVIERRRPLSFPSSEDVLAKLAELEG